MTVLLSDINLKFKRRTLRPLYATTQAYPLAATLDSSFDRTAGQLAGAGAITNSNAAIMAGSVLVKSVGKTVTLSGAHGTTTNNERPLGLCQNNVGGGLDELGSLSNVGVWRGTGSTFLLLAPAFDTTNLSTDAAAEDGTAPNEVYLNSGSKGVLVCSAGANVLNNCARLMAYHSANSIEIELLV